MGKRVTGLRSSQRQLAPDRIGLGFDEPTLLRARSTRTRENKAYRFQHLYGCLNETLPHLAWKKLDKHGIPGVDEAMLDQALGVC